MDRKTLTADEVAEALGVSVGLIYEAARQGQLPFLRIGRRLVMPVSALERLLDSRAERGDAENG